LSDHADAALTIRNLVSRSRYQDAASEHLPRSVEIGVAIARRRLYQAEVDYVFQGNRAAAVSAGLELHVVPGALDLRLGVDQRIVTGQSRTLPSAGAGIAAGSLRFDYAVLTDPDGGFGAQHRLALGARF